MKKILAMILVLSMALTLVSVAAAEGKSPVDGMTVAFSPYELAAYVVGAQVYYLDYTQLMPYLSPHGVELLGLESTEGEAPSGK